METEKDNIIDLPEILNKTIPNIIYLENVKNKIDNKKKEAFKTIYR